MSYKVTIYTDGDVYSFTARGQERVPDLNDPLICLTDKNGTTVFNPAHIIAIDYIEEVPEPEQPIAPINHSWWKMFCQCDSCGGKV
jgi:hypothetical protein